MCSVYVLVHRLCRPLPAIPTPRHIEQPTKRKHPQRATAYCHQKTAFFLISITVTIITPSTVVCQNSKQTIANTLVVHSLAQNRNSLSVSLRLVSDTKPIRGRHSHRLPSSPYKNIVDITALHHQNVILSTRKSKFVLVLSNIFDFTKSD